MKKSRSLAILILVLACFFLIDCQTAGTPTQTDDATTKTVSAAGPQAPPPADSTSKSRTASYSGNVRSVASVQRKNPMGKAVDRLGKPTRAIMVQKINTLRLILYAALAIIFAVVIGAITAERVERRRKLTPASLNARQ